jgi:nucleoside-diphosphate-sugar epimerase
MNNKILVTGGAGYVGTTLVPLLLKLNYKVLVIDTFWFGNYLPKHKRLTTLKKNILDVEEKELKGIHSIIHLASVANDTASDLDPKLTWEISCLGTKHLCDVAKNVGVKKFIFASSGSVYGVKKEKQVNEKLNCEPISDYNKTKIVAEKIVESYKKYFKYYNIRPSTLYGASPRMRLDLTMNILTKHAALKNQIKVFGGKQWRPFLHVKDMANIYIHFLRKNLKQGSYNASDGNLRVIDKAKIIQKLSKNCKIKITKSNDIRSYRLSSEKLIKTGFKFKHELIPSLYEMYQMFKDGKIKDLPNFYSLKWLSEFKNKN